MHDGHGRASSDLIEVTILDDGRVKVETFGEISEVNHMSAERFLALMAEAYEGAPTRTRKGHTHVHHHDKVRR